MSCAPGRSPSPLNWRVCPPCCSLMGSSDEGSCSARLLGREDALINYSGLKGVGEEGEDGGALL